MRQYIIANRLVVMGEIQLGEVDILIEQPFGMREFDACDYRCRDFILELALGETG
jgi:hypothetical protein